MFRAMKDAIKEETVRQLFLLRAQIMPQVKAAQEAAAAAAQQQAEANGQVSD